MQVESTWKSQQDFTHSDKKTEASQQLQDYLKAVGTTIM